jgi:hypothetical protein
MHRFRQRLVMVELVEILELLNFFTSVSVIDLVSSV